MGLIEYELGGVAIPTMSSEVGWRSRSGIARYAMSLGRDKGAVTYLDSVRAVGLPENTSGLDRCIGLELLSVSLSCHPVLCRLLQQPFRQCNIQRPISPFVPLR